LLTVVELRDAAGPEHGSPHLISSLANETEARTRSMDFAEAAPSRPVARLAGAAGFVVLGSLMAAAAVPGSGERLRRVGLPWHRPAVVVAYRVVVSSGNPVVKRGDPVTLTGYVERTDPRAAVPEAALLVFRDGAGSTERKLPMAGDGSGAFHVTRPSVSGDFEYRVEVGHAASDWHTVLAADPVELTDQTTAEINPPTYATTTPKKSVPAATELDGLQHSSALLTLKFNRSCATAFLDWRPESNGPTEVIPVALAADSLSGTATFAMTQHGVLRVVTINENSPRKLRSESVLAVRVTPDAAPRFEQVSGVTTGPRTVRPGEHVPITLTATDDLAVAKAEIEYAVGASNANTVRIPMPLAGLGTPRAQGRFVFDLAGKGSEGEVIRFRVRVADNRHLDAPKLDPQEAVYPPTGWAELKLSASAPPLEHQEIVGQRDAFRAALADALKDVKQATDDTDKVRTESANRNALALHHTVTLNAARDRARTAANTLHTAGRDAALTPELRPIAAAARDIADRTLKDADDQLRKSLSDVPTDRKPALNAAIKKLVEAADQIESLMERNARFAQDRLDGHKLDALAADQTALAEKAKPDGTPSDELAKLQQELLDRLRKLVADSPPLKTAAGATTGREALRLSREAKALAGMLRDLDRAAKQLTADSRRALLVSLSRAQAALADRAAAVLTQTATATRLAGVTPPKPEDFRRVADLLAQDRVIAALTELERLAQATEHVAEAFEKWAAERADAKLAAKQLALWQEDFRGRYAGAVRGTAFDRLPDPTKASLRLEQQAIRGLVDRLKLPPGDGVASARKSASTSVGQAVTVLAGDGKGADTAMTTAVKALNHLADAIPTLAERLTNSRKTLEGLRLEQESIAAAAADLTRTADPAFTTQLAKKLQGWHQRQQRQLPPLLALDLPGLESRQERIAVALKAAASDLEAGLAFDVFASQAWAKREFERLRSALDRAATVDDRADDLARRLTAAADALDPLAEPTTRQLEPVAAAFQDAQKQLASFVTPEAVALLHDARETVRVAESGIRDNTKADELKRRVRAASDALTKLAARLNGAEADADRLKRLAANRRQASEDGAKLRGKAYDPAASTDARNQLVRESEELAHTRVGAAAQLSKKKVVEQYERLRKHNEPDRPVALQKSLADALDELASQMADIAELTTGRDLTPPAVTPDPADAFLPSKPLADALRAFAKDERALRDAVNGVNGEVARRTKPSDADPLAAIEKKQRLLAADIGAFAKGLIAEKDMGAADAAGKAAESARLAADRLQVGATRAAKEPGESTAQRLKQLAATAGDRAWGKTATGLAARQEAIITEITAVLDNAANAAARQRARQEELAKQAFELGHMLDISAKNAPAGEAGSSLAEAAELARGAEKMLTDAGKAVQGEGEKVRAAAEKMLADAATKAAPQGDAGEPTAAADAVRQAEAAMRTAADQLGAKGDRPAAEQSMRQAADLLNRAAKSAVGSPSPPPPEGSPNAASQSNGNTGAGTSATTTGDLTPTLPENWGANWGNLPGDVKGKIMQDLKARFGDDYARVIKLYFEQLAEKK
ncbi:MAG TPA: hypothetical protein VMZ71_05750, partial [Gemmataceae bacterium]|nr:hypothetical protein [Gemmataceae bacterium]